MALLTLNPPSLSLGAGQRKLIHALKGGRVDPTLIEWSVSNPKVVGLDHDTGELRTIGPGQAVVTARFMGETASTTVTVSGQAPLIAARSLAPQIGQQAGTVLASLALGAAFVATGSYLEKELLGIPAKKKRR